jgi:hypothetical protein
MFGKFPSALGEAIISTGLWMNSCFPVDVFNYVNQIMDGVTIGPIRHRMTVLPTGEPEIRFPPINASVCISNID